MIIYVMTYYGINTRNYKLFRDCGFNEYARELYEIKRHDRHALKFRESYVIASLYVRITRNEMLFTLSRAVVV